MLEKLESIFDHDITNNEAKKIFGWSKITDELKDWYLKKKNQDSCFLDLNTLYEIRGKMEVAQGFLEKCKDQKRAQKHGFHYY